MELVLDEAAVTIPDLIVYNDDVIQKLKLDVFFLDDATVRFKIYDAEKARYEVPIEISAPVVPSTDLDKDGNPARMYLIETEHTPFRLRIRRRSDNVVIFETAGPIIFYNQFLQLSTVKPSNSLYGFGETEHYSFQYNTEWTSQGMWARDNGVGPDSNLYGHQPYHVGLEPSGHAHGIMFINSNAMEVALNPKPVLTYRTVGGILDFMIFLGPSVEGVTQQMTHYFGRSPLFPYWSIGFQICRYGYNYMETLETVVEENRAAGIPYDIQYADIDYMERRLDFTIADENSEDPRFAGIQDYFDKMRDEYNMRTIIILDPAISIEEENAVDGAWVDVNGVNYPTFSRGRDMGVYIMGEDGEIEVGKVWPYKPGVYDADLIQDGQGWDENIKNFHAVAAFPDFFNPATHDWWKNEIQIFYNGTWDGQKGQKGMHFDGIWIDMNEPASFTAGRPGSDGGNQWQRGCDHTPSPLNNPPYIPRSLNEFKNNVGLFEKTVCMTGKQWNPMTQQQEDHYNVHSLYGLSQGKPSLDACQATTGERCLIVSRSTFPGAQKHIGHWHGDNSSIWRHIKQGLIATIEFSLFGFSYTGPDICGFFGEAEREMCMRWQQIGAFFVYSRNHNGLENRRQDPAAWGPDFINSVKPILEDRYRLLPYLYTLLYRANQYGDTVVRSVMANDQYDSKTWNIDEQMMWGNGLMISPALHEGQTIVDAYFPKVILHHDRIFSSVIRITLLINHF